MKRFLQNTGYLGLALMATLSLAVAAAGQVTVGDDLKMNMNGSLSAGYSGNFSDNGPSSHSLSLGADANLFGSYYNPNFLNFSIEPYYNRSTANSSFQSLTDATGLNANTNLFSGSRYPAYASFAYTRNSTGNYGLIGTPNFTTIGNGYSFGLGWSLLLPNKPTFSISYAQSSGSGNVYGTNEESSSATKSLNLRSSYMLAGWNLSAGYQFLDVSANIPYFLSGTTTTTRNTSDFKDNFLSASAYHRLGWNGGLGINYSHANYSGNYDALYFGQVNNTTSATDTENANASFHPTTKFGLFGSESYTNNLSGYFYQSLTNNGNGVPLLPMNTQSDSFTMAGGASYQLTRYIYTSAQVTYFNQQYLGRHYDGSYLTATLGANKRFLNTFAVSASMIESTNKFVNNSLGYMANVSAFRNFWGWEMTGNFNYSQNVQTLLVTYTTSSVNYNANVHKQVMNGKQWTFAFNGSHSGFEQYKGADTHSEGFATSFAMRRFTLTANYNQVSGQSILTSTGIQPVPPTPGLLPQGLIVYNGKSYGAGLGWTPLPRLSLTGSYSHAVSDTLSNDIYSKNRTEIYYGQMQYRLRRINLMAGFTKFSQGISASGTPPGSQYSYFIGVSRWLNFF